MWDQRYAESGWAYGTEPNAFLALCAPRLPRGRALCLADGEGRNGVFLATLSFDVTSVDLSSVGLAKARGLAASRGVEIATVAADLAGFVIEPGAWDAIVSISCHLPQPLRADVHRRCVAGLRPGGAFLLEAYAPRQLEFHTGGPASADLLMDLGDVKRELAGLRFDIARESEREVVEGRHHTGRAAVTQILAFQDGIPARL
ncbi:MAG: class I SAM-dependent methyltransferase [Verrucomicrobia bacterium]|nr:class I SAM-dependent methyltransferase [Verrucomicrobiota bacterium]